MSDKKTRFEEVLDGWVNRGVEVAPIGTLLGFRFTSFEKGRVTAEMEAGPRHHNPMGIVHGGIFCDLADAAMGMAFATTLADDESFVTLQLQASYLRAVREGLLVATGRVVHRGRTVGHTECEVVDGEGRPVARLTSVCSVLGGK
jgi:uncharacterized protein (TIGR00369 family)